MVGSANWAQDPSVKRSSTPERHPKEEEWIELTPIVKKWAMKFPEGQLGVDMENESKLFARFPAGFDTFRDASATPVSREDQDALRHAYDAMIARAEKMRSDMAARGETVDLAKIKKDVFGHIPEGMVPPQYVPELQDWRKVRDAFQARAVKAMQPPPAPTTGDKAKAGTETVSKIAEYSGKGLELADAVMKVFPNEKAEAITKLLKDILGRVGTAADSAGTAIEGAQAATTVEENPVKQKMNDDKVLSSLQTLASTGVDLAAEFVPFLGTLKNGAECLAAIKETQKRVSLRASTGDLQAQAAANTTSQLSKAFEQSQGRETRLATEGAMDVVDKGLGTAAGALRDTGIGAKAGVALTAVQKALKLASKLAFFVVDEGTARKAVEVLDRARAGDTLAQVEVFREHGHYAKMLIAIWGKAKDPLAEKYLIDRGLTVEDIGHKATDIDILFDYAVQESKETEEPKPLMERLKPYWDKAASLAASVAAAAERCLVWTGAMKAAAATPQSVITAPTPPPPTPTPAEVREMWEHVELIRAELALGNREDPEWVKARQPMLDLLAKLADLDAKFRRAGQETKEELAIWQGRAAEQAKKGGDTPEPDPAKQVAGLLKLDAQWTALVKAMEAKAG
jgi:hypothetical protein